MIWPKFIDTWGQCDVVINELVMNQTKDLLKMFQIRSVKCWWTVLSNQQVSFSYLKITVAVAIAIDSKSYYIGPLHRGLWSLWHEIFLTANKLKISYIFKIMAVVIFSIRIFLF